ALGTRGHHGGRPGRSLHRTGGARGNDRPGGHPLARRGTGRRCGPGRSTAMTALIATLERVESHLPDRRVATETLAEPLGLSRAKMSLFRKVHGLHTLHQDPEATLFDLLLPAARQVVESLADPRRIRFVIYVHAIHEVAPAGFDAAAVLRDALGLGHAEAF